MSLKPHEQITTVLSRGSYSRFVRNYLGMSAELVDATGVGVDDAVLDTGCRTGDIAITAARRGATVAGVDVMPAMLAQAADNAETAGVDGITWYNESVTELPFEADRFDVALASQGHIYAEPSRVLADELPRVTRPGGHIGFTAWTPNSLHPIILGLVLTYLPKHARPEYSDPPFMWGDRDFVEQRLRGRITDLRFERMTLLYPALSPSHFWDELVAHSKIFVRFLDAVEDRERLRDEGVETIAPYFDDSENALALEYLMTTGTVTATD